MVNYAVGTSITSHSYPDYRLTQTLIQHRPYYSSLSLRGVLRACLRIETNCHRYHLHYLNSDDQEGRTALIWFDDQQGRMALLWASMFCYQ